VEQIACQPDACPCFKGGSNSCVMPSWHGRNYWQGEATVARLAQLEQGVDQSQQVWTAKREARRAARARGIGAGTRGTNTSASAESASNEILLLVTRAGH